MVGNGTDGRSVRLVAALGVVAAAVASAAAPADDLTFRPTVIVRNRTGQGSGTVIASVPGETLVLTAAHVVRGRGKLSIELHRYNLGVERALPARGWPLSLPAEVAASDPAADVAVLRVRGRPALPFVARLSAVGDEPARGSVVTSVGVDGGEALQSWATQVRQVVWFALADDAPDGPTLTATRQAPGGAADPADRPFLITVKAPVPGRSGGGLFLDGGRLVGVCVGRIERGRGRASGVFASVESVRKVLREHELDAVVAQTRRHAGGP